MRASCGLSTWTLTRALLRTATRTHADDFMSEYSKTFKGERGEAEAYCYYFKEEGNLDNLRKVHVRVPCVCTC